MSSGVIAIDGKTLRGTYQEGGAKAPIHMISAWSCRQNLVLGQAKVADKSNEAIRGHRSIENGLHWVMDMVFRDDECRIRKHNAPANFSTVKHMASNLLRRALGNDSLR